MVLLTFRNRCEGKEREGERERERERESKESENGKYLHNKINRSSSVF